MTTFILLPRIVKVLRVTHTPYGYRDSHKRAVGRRLHVGTTFIAEHSRTPGLEAGDRFIIEE